MARAAVVLPVPMLEEIATLQGNKQSLEKEVEDFLSNVASEKQLQVDVAKAKADDIARLQGQLAEVQRSVSEAKALFAKEEKDHAAALVTARKDATAWVKKELSEGVEKKAQEIIASLQNESKRLDVQSVESEKTADTTEAKQKEKEKAQAGAEEQLAAAKKEAETAGVGDPEALAAMEAKVAEATSKASAAEAENQELKQKAVRVAELQTEIKELRERIAKAPKIDEAELERLRAKKKRIDAVDMEEVERLREMVAKLPSLQAEVKDLRKAAEEAAKVDLTEIESLREKVAKGPGAVEVPAGAVPAIDTKELDELKQQAAKLPALEAELASLTKQIESKNAENAAKLEELRKSAREDAMKEAAAAAAAAGGGADSAEIASLKVQAKSAADLEAEIAALRAVTTRLPQLEHENQTLKQQLGK
ncbi:hypothetical protein CBR_g3680 [Chara braunii]|uniref:Uncharacterized protein n=1 Tax=Chara braunii TaxID=69332 RepID=A0A388KG12_CHABU|nr:hypothetical protein CBR_g3680 [Chara braunii]|eukprot:GBG68981.1 hypothetical protein CBR_g3680 [Chara braunii]